MKIRYCLLIAFAIFFACIAATYKAYYSDPYEVFIEEVISGNDPDDVLINEIMLNIDDMYGFFVAIDVESPEYNGRAVTDNYELLSYLQFPYSWHDYLYHDDGNYSFYNLYGYYHHFRQIQSMNKYVKIMYNMLKEKSTLKIEKKGDFDKYNFRIVPNDSTVIANAQKGVDHFIKTYTNSYSYIDYDEKIIYQYTLKGGISTDEFYAIVNQLYNFNIGIQMDCESGSWNVLLVPDSISERLNEK